MNSADTRVISSGDDVAPKSRVTPRIASLLAMCVFVAMAEGYDSLAMALAAPMLAKSWGIPPAAIGVLLTTSVAGMIFGNLVLAPLGDHWGRRPTILLSLSIACIGTFTGAVASDIPTLLVTRVIAGIGLGMAIPNVLSIVTELAPQWFRTYAVVLVGCGYPLGGSIGGWISSRFSDDYGYVAVFVVGGLATLVSIGLCAAFLPESQSFIRSTSGKALTSSAGSKSRRKWDSIFALFDSRFRSITILLWIVSFAQMAITYFFLSWLPSVLVAKGLDIGTAIRATSIFNASGILGGIILAWAVSRMSVTYVISLCFLINIAAIVALTTNLEVGILFWLMIAICGLITIGSQFAFIAISNQFYPTSIRATGAGYVSGAGRFGALVAPLAGGFVMSATASVEYTFSIAAVAAAIGLVAIILLHTTTTFSKRMEQTTSNGDD